MRKVDEILKEFRQIPGVGKVVGNDLYSLGLRSIDDLKDKDPEELYLRLCAQKGEHVDRCALYVFRCAVTYANSDEEEGKDLRWWYFKDEAND